MNAALDAITVALIPACGVMGMICIASGLEYLCNIYYGYTPAPRWWSRRYWHGVLVRVVCRLAELEAAWEQRKSPRKAGTKRGIVGQRVRRSACVYSQIIPQSAGNVKSDFAVAWKWMRG